MICFSGVTILLSLTVFSQVLADTMPATSDAIPLLGKNFKTLKKWASNNTYTHYSLSNQIYVCQAATFIIIINVDTIFFSLKQLKANQINRCKKYILWLLLP